MPLGDKRHLVLTKHTEGAEPPTGVQTRSESLPPVLLQQTQQRLPQVSLILFCTVVIAWGLQNLSEGELAGEFDDLGQWGPPVLILVASLAVYVTSRRRLVTASMLANVGLVYEVVVSYGTTLGQHWGAFAGLAASDLNGDRVGLPHTVAWMFFYTALVPARPNRALVALLASASATPVSYAVAASIGLAPTLSAQNFFWTMVFPSLMCAVLAYMMARMIFRLGTDLRRAREMGSYRLEEVIGRGGMGEVWKASHRMLARPAAIKLITRQALGSDPASVDAALARFEREAQVTAMLRSPHTVELFDFGVAEDGSLYYVMEFLEGVDLDTLVKTDGPMSPGRAVRVLRQVCSSLAEAHWQGLVHRDIKPANIVLCQQGLQSDFVKVLDFGLVKRHANLESSELTKLTKQDAVTGTPAFLPPEIVLGKGEVDGRADLYALGCVGYWLITGRLVFDTPTVVGIMAAHAHVAPEAPSTYAPGPLPAALDALILRCLAKTPDERPASAQALAEELDGISISEPWTDDDAARWWRERAEAAKVQRAGRHRHSDVGCSMLREVTPFASLIARLRRTSVAADPHALADRLCLADGSPAPAGLRLWSGFDNRYPTYLSCRRSEQTIADARGVVIAQPMSSVLRWVCLDSIRDEVEDDDETVAYLEELIEGFTDEFSGFGVYLEPQETPDRVLWFGPEGRATVLWYDDDQFERREDFEDYAVRIFEDD